MAEGSAPEWVVVHCPACARRLQVPATAIGRKGKCPHCSRVFTVPRTAAPADQALLSMVGGDRTTHLERLGTRNGIILGGVVAGAAVLAVVILVAWSLLVNAPSARATDNPKTAPSASQADAVARP